MTASALESGNHPRRLACRLYDGDLRSAQENAALDGRLPALAPALRFSRYPVSGVLGAHERAAIAVRGEYCEEQGIEVVRRATGGGALYLDPSQLWWSLALPADHSGHLGLAGVLEAHGSAMVAALRQLGVPAQFVFPNDIEVQGRKLGSGFAGRVDDTILIQGSLLVTPPDAESMLKILRVPTEKLSREGVLSARQRLTSVEEVTGSAPGTARIRDVLSQAFAETFALHLLPVAPMATQPVEYPRPPLDEAPAADAMKAFVKTAGGAVYLAIAADPQGRVVQAAFSGAVQFAPSDLFARLGAGLRGRLLQDCGGSLEGILRDVAGVDLLGFGIGDLQRLVALATARGEQGARFGLDREQSNTLIVHSPHGEEAAEILEQATVMLVPYCAKLADCKFRFRDGCSECGMCEVGDAYAMARERGMRVVSITNFEHLLETLEGMRAEEVPAYVGMCCESFYLKRHYAFEAAGIPAVLTDITGATCYELREEDLAYAGRFRAEAHLKLDVVEKVMHFVPHLPDADAAPGTPLAAGSETDPAPHSRTVRRRAQADV
ncbi:lipoyl protein ligase domain-containing protein [Thioalkalivibrio sp.]|uniref:lipoyl protein ligase domain-containing protein n=1 Tax=Thioalkalivibrio sp. TaxID=2093813 RepID=UPI00397534B0